MRAPLLALAAAIAGCAPPSPAVPATRPAPIPDLALPGSDGAPHRLADLVRAAPLTIIVFFSADCPCQRAHDARLRDLFAAYRPRGVDLVAVDSEATAAPAADRDEARARGYAFPLLSDPGGAVADALGAVYATYAVVIDAGGRVRYRGGIDSDRSHVTPDAAPWLRDALDRLLAGREPDPAETTSLGCALRRR
jgi:peroxiredoxin